MHPERLPGSRPPCSRGELAAAAQLRAYLRGLGLPVGVERFPALTSHAWVPLTGALLRLSAAVLVLAERPVAALAVAGAALAASAVPALFAEVYSRLPLLGGRSVNVLTRIRGGGRSGDPPLFVVAHLDSAARGASPPGPLHRLLSALVGAFLISAAALLMWRDGLARWVLVVAALEPLATMVRLAASELRSVPPDGGDDNDSGLAALHRAAELLAADRPVRDVWLAGTGAGTSGSWGARTLLRRNRRAARTAWLIELDSLGSAELVISPAVRRLPRAKTPAPVLRAVAGAALDTGDLLAVRRMRRWHSDAEAAFRAGVPALTITAGVAPPDAPDAPDPANAERAALVVDHLARTAL